ncbi:MAG: response regulator transcription factor [Acidobacteria bacterium]|nr:response regulator transcription factor [Acidobacteriota bacterium]
MNFKVLVVEDETTLRVTIRDRLVAEGYEVSLAADGNQGFELLRTGQFDVAISDIMMPGRSGTDLVRDVRAQGIQTPILLLTAKRDVVDKVIGLKMGADDYLTKPFEMVELMARVEALLRRARAPQAKTTRHYCFGDVVIDYASGLVSRDGETVAMTPLDYRLLTYLVEHRGEVLSRDRLLDEVWGYDTGLMTRTVDVHMVSLRQKLEPVPENPRYLVTVHRRGYRFVPD